MTSTTPAETKGGGAGARRVVAPGLLAGDRRGPGGLRPRRARSWGLVTLAALLVLGSGLAVTAWGLHAGQKVSVLAAGEPVAKGQVVGREDLVSVSVAGVDGAIPVSELDTVVGQRAAVDLVEGQVLTADMVTSDPTPGEGEASIGLSLDPARVPGAGLAPGDVVDVIAVPDANGKVDPAGLDAPEVLASGARVFDVGGEATTGGQVLVTLIVDAGDAARVAAYSTQNRVAVVETAPEAASKGGE